MPLDIPGGKSPLDMFLKANAIKPFDPVMVPSIGPGVSPMIKAPVYDISIKSEPVPKSMFIPANLDAPKITLEVAPKAGMESFKVPLDWSVDTALKIGPMTATVEHPTGQIERVKIPQGLAAASSKINGIASSLSAALNKYRLTPSSDAAAALKKAVGTAPVTVDKGIVAPGVVTPQNWVTEMRPNPVASVQVTPKPINWKVILWGAAAVGGGVYLYRRKGKRA